MTGVARLVTIVDVEDRADDNRRMSLSARHEAVLADGRRVLLLGDRGWTEELITRSDDLIDIWSETSADEIEHAARAVVGPDEPFEGRSRDDMEADHWAYLAEILRRHGVIAEPEELRRLPHDVELGRGLLARLRRS